MSGLVPSVGFLRSGTIGILSDIFNCLPIVNYLYIKLKLVMQLTLLVNLKNYNMSVFLRMTFCTAV